MNEQEYKDRQTFEKEMGKLQKPVEFDPQIKTAESINSTLAERGSRYGLFVNHAAITQELKLTMKNTDNWKRLTASQKEALEMIAHKIGRILNGDPNYADSWHDIVGYAKLIDDELQGITN